MAIRISRVLILCSLLSAAVPVPPAHGRDPSAQRGRSLLSGPDKVLIIDGTSVHNVGELQMHFLNWGEWGSRPGTAEPYSDSPSAQWPAGTGVEYLFSAGLWVGALRSGVPAVSTAAFENEFRPSADVRDRVYKSGEGEPGGRRAPANADDDGDGSADEDVLDGHDNDGDGLVDEDYAAISRQMYACTFNDYEQVARSIYPQHNPLNILIRQESYQWDGDDLDDFVAVDYTITNVGKEILEDIYIGMFVDGDAGKREFGNYWDDDLTGITSLGPFCTNQGPLPGFDVAYIYDGDGDGGATPGYFGVTFLGLSEEATGPTHVAPAAQPIHTYAYFSGFQSFQTGGDPTNDFERYELLAEGSYEPEPALERDYRMLVSTGPLDELRPGQSMHVQLAFVIGAGVEGMTATAVKAQQTFLGSWVDLDNDPATGVDGRERPVPGQIRLHVDFCRRTPRFGDPGGCDFQERWDQKFWIEEAAALGDTLWVNDDCTLECARRFLCSYTVSDSLIFRTGVAGRESRVPWIVDVPPPPPHFRVDDHGKRGPVIYWDNRSEVIPDGLTNRIDFEGYVIWRADQWTRPLGTSVRTGPPAELWSALHSADVVNGVGDDTGLGHLRYEPLRHFRTPVERRQMMDAMIDVLWNDPNAEVPCPAGVDEAVCDTLEALARWDIGYPGGREYYHYVDKTVQLGRPYFYSVVAADHSVRSGGVLVAGQMGDPSSNFVYVEPQSAAQQPYAFDPNQVYVVPNPATRESMQAWALSPNNDDPTGIKIEFRNLPRSRGTIRIYTLAGDLVVELPFDGTTGVGTVPWDLVSRNSQTVTSGIYLYSIDFEGGAFDRVIGKFVIIL